MWSIDHLLKANGIFSKIHAWGPNNAQMPTPTPCNLPISCYFPEAVQSFPLPCENFPAGALLEEETARLPPPWLSSFPFPSFQGQLRLSAWPGEPCPGHHRKKPKRYRKVSGCSARIASILQKQFSELGRGHQVSLSLS